ncbi:hypothetical protein FRAAL3752 [Frankia alni ACN14a]|uniref:Uncharacterized protein n=1 Tax=Frankia alni (strain DSM 45986 / CECT 9034 / ACN14a) TaxID=326424 RepID=Q0RJB7_FRAAA|nr:hypothetical protein FRAAL3752 [Frankia alni ACN14a]
MARVAARTRLSAELLAAILEVERRTRATLDDIERADALAERLLVRRGRRLRATGARGAQTGAAPGTAVSSTTGLAGSALAGSALPGGGLPGGGLPRGGSGRSAGTAADSADSFVVDPSGSGEQAYRASA